MPDPEPPPGPLEFPSDEPPDDAWTLDPLGFPDETEFDSRPPEEVLNLPTVNPNLLALMDRYLESGNSPKVVRDHIPNLVRLLCAKVADRYNRRNPIHWYAPGVPFQYKLHGMLLGSSGFGKGATVSQFFHLIAPFEGESALFPTWEFKGGSPESMRGGVTQDRPSDPKLVKPGSLERTDYGFLHIPEFSQLVKLGERYGGTIESVLAWADTGSMSYETVSGRAVTYHSDSTLVVGLQTARLNEIDTAVAGWARRAFYDQFVVPSTDDIDPLAVDKDGKLKRPKPINGNPALLREFRQGVKTLVKGFGPTSIDWTPFLAFLSKVYRAQMAVSQDEQMLVSMALADHIANGGAWTGDIVVQVPKYLEAVFDRFITNKRLARISIERRIANESLDVLLDTYVLGQGQTIKESEAVRIVAARLSVPEQTVLDAFVPLRDRGFILTEARDENGVKSDWVKLKPR